MLKERKHRYAPRPSRRVITYHDAELIRELREYHQLAISVLAEKFELSESAIKAILSHRTYADH